MAIEIVDLPIKNGDFPQFFVHLPEGKTNNSKGQWSSSPLELPFWGGVSPIGQSHMEPEPTVYLEAAKFGSK